MQVQGRARLRELLHICGLHVNDVKSLVGDVQVPEVDTQVVGGDEGLLIAAQRNAVHVIGVRIGIFPPAARRQHHLCAVHLACMCAVAPYLYFGNCPMSHPLPLHLPT